MGLDLKVVCLASATILTLASTSSAQNFGNPANTRIQLPVVSFFNVRTVVSVPDAGVMSLGGVSRHASGQSSRGIPGLGRAFTNRSRGYSTAGSNASVKVLILSNSEMSEDVLAIADRQEAIYRSNDPNGSKSVQAKADFISKNVGRSRRK